ncbi:DUF4097 family beta strand repeat-containing protein [Levilactobacillus suantsaiihabitans]|uniref:DUF4097 domain-containing protein n=1 Tax=Levilactobacillus suantsaiihabitans TaxID=2487722 RepID=A0A4Z0J6D4_9LACO|nr:DUF4097 family beta strand repeat-containing protein [Levilactobacillus suantsaiihabitans]TGD17648.1 hypothetical protein EGT51_11410 [Levilactobacillus suantsaiihabitans]
MDDITMEIRTRLDQLFSQYQPSRALTELKEELVGDLTEAVTDKINQGQDTQAAIDAAMADLGDIDTLLKEVAADDTGSADTPTDDDQEDQSADQHHSQSDVQIGKLKIHDDKVTWGDHVLVDGENDKVDFGKLVKVDGDHVTVANGLVDVNGDDVKINGERPRRTFVESLRLVNTQSFAVTDLERLEINYRDAAVKLGPANADEIVVNEYMSRDNARYYLHASRHGNVLQVNQGDRPRLWPLHARAEIFLPAQLAGKVTVQVGNGSLEISDLRAPVSVDAHASNGSMRAFDDQLARLTLRSANGSVRLDQVKADHIAVDSKNGSVTLKESTATVHVESHNGAIRFYDHTGNVSARNHNGTIKLDGLTGDVQAASANGSLRGQNLRGGGRYHTDNGSVNLQFNALPADVQVDSQGGSTTLQMPLLTAYAFDVKNRNASVRTPQEAKLSLDDEHHKVGAVGENPTVHVGVLANTGSIRLI